MRKRTMLQFAGLALVAVAAMSNSGCPLVPEVQKRTVELAIGGSTTADFTAAGDINFHNDTQVVDLASGLDLAQLVRDAGIDPDKIKDVKISGLSYRTSRPDPTAGRAIVDGSITVARGTGAAVPLVASFNADVNSATSFQGAALSAEGVTLLNGVVADMLNEIKTGVPAGNTTLTIHVTGVSTPSGVPTDFEYQLKLDVSIVGTIEQDVIG